MKELSHAQRLQLNVPTCESPFWRDWVEARGLGERERELFQTFIEDGYLVIDLGLEGFAGLAEAVDRDLRPWYARGEHRVHDAWYHSRAVRELAILPLILELLAMLYGRRAIPFQTLNFDTGTEQPAHSDTIHFHCVPRHYMCGVWVALERIDEGCGPLVVYPGSHRLPDYDMLDLGLPSGTSHYQSYEELVRAMLAAAGFEERVVTVERGQAIVWAANLFHGGTAVTRAGSTRKSQVTHYYFEDCAYYFPMGSDAFVGKPCLREVIDLTTGRFVPHRYRGRELSLLGRPLLRYPRPLPTGVRAPWTLEVAYMPKRLWQGLKGRLGGTSAGNRPYGEALTDRK